MSELETNKLYTVEEARQLLKYKSKKTIYRAIKDGKLKTKRTPSGRYLILEESLNEFLK